MMLKIILCIYIQRVFSDRKIEFLNEAIFIDGVKIEVDKEEPTKNIYAKFKLII